jgi:hypothetical protein
VALVNPVGTQITWWVLVTPTAGTDVAAAAYSRRADRRRGHRRQYGRQRRAGGLTSRATWQPGDLQLVYLDAWIDVNSATVLPVRAQIS